MIQTFIDFFTQVAAQWGLLIVFVITFLETSVMLGLLVPGETTVLLAGALASQGVMDIWALIVIVCCAGLLGDNVGYILGRRLGRDFVLRHGHIFRVREEHFVRADSYFERRGGTTILFGRWIGFFRSLAPFVAGSAHMSYPRFAVYDFFGVLSWGVASCLLGYLFGASYTLIDQWLGRLSLFALVTVVAFVLLWLFGRYLSRHRAALEGLTGRVTDRVLDWSPILAFRHRFARQIAWVFARFSPREAYGLGLTIGLLVTLAFGYLFGLMTNTILDRGRFFGIDGWVADVVEENRVPWVTQLMKVVTQFGGAAFLLAATAVIVGVLVWRRKRWEALTLFTATAGSLLAVFILQGLVQRPRPTIPAPLIDVGGYGFPSAHATGSMAFYLTVALLATGWVRSWETRVYLLVGALAVSLAIGFSRVYLGVHYMSDVLAGYALGIGWLTLSVTAATVFLRALPSAGEDSPEREQRVDDPKIFSPHKARMLDDEGRLALLAEDTVAELLELGGDEDIVDLGSGTGFWSERLAARTSGTVYAVELQSEMQELHAARTIHPNVRLVLAHVDELPLAPGSVDRALSIYTFHEAHAAAGLELVARALRPGGRLVIVDWRKSPGAADVGPPLAHRLSLEEVGALLAPWFRVIRSDHLNEHLSVVVSEPLVSGP